MTNEQLLMLLYGLRDELNLAIEDVRGKLIDRYPDSDAEDLWPLETFVKTLSERMDLLRVRPPSATA